MSCGSRLATAEQHATQVVGHLSVATVSCRRERGLPGPVEVCTRLDQDADDVEVSTLGRIAESGSPPRVVSIRLRACFEQERDHGSTPDPGRDVESSTVVVTPVSSAGEVRVAVQQATCRRQISLADEP